MSQRNRLASRSQVDWKMLEQKESMHIQNMESDLRCDTYMVVFTHLILILLLFGDVYYWVSLPAQLLLEIGGTFPLSGRLLIGTGRLWEHPAIVSLLAVGFLVADGRIYASLCRAKGKRAGALWACGVTTTIVLVIIWYSVLGRLFLNVMIGWKIK